MRLTRLIASSEDLKLTGEDREIAGITADSREAGPEFLFAAIPGTKHDGRAFISDAIKRGAVAVLAPRDAAKGLPKTVAIVETGDMRAALSGIAARFYPRQPETIAAVTGTSGKTSTVQFAREIWQALGKQSASIGTLGLVTAKESRTGSLTTPDAITLHKLLDEIAGGGVTHLAMEASSHGLALHRLDHVRIKVAAFTNLSRDHLDFHNTMEEYRAAKLRLFAELLPADGMAVLNADSDEFDALLTIARTRKQKIFSYGTKGKEIRLLDVKVDAKGQVLRLELLGKNQEILLPVAGDFQALNALCALGIAIACGAEPKDAAQALVKVSGVPGRLQLAGQTKSGGTVFVDYAHKPDALENVLATLRAHVKDHKLGVVFGCGGERDAGKRPMMGEIASRLADWAIVTDDNPRHEDPAAIRKQILAGCKKGDVQESGDRAEAIAAGIKRLGPGDALVIAGKGHESGQQVGDKILPFDDITVARNLLER